MLYIKLQFLIRLKGIIVGKPLAITAIYIRLAHFHELAPELQLVSN